MTFLGFLSRGFTVVLPELDEDLDEVFLLGVYDVCDLICCNPWNELIDFYMRTISGVVCHGNNDKCWSDDIMKCSYDGIHDVIWNDFCVNYCDCDFNIQESVTVILTCYVCACLSSGV